MSSSWKTYFRKFHWTIRLRKPKYESNNAQTYLAFTDFFDELNHMIFDHLC